MDTHLFITFFMCLLSRAAVCQVQRCSMKTCSSTEANSTQDSQSFDLQLSNTTDNGKINVSVKMLGSITLQSQTAKYFKIESYTIDSLEPAGTFSTPSQSSEVERCSNNAIVFYSCEPRVTDLLRTYEWSAPIVEVGEVCFRLSILKDGENETCEHVTKCTTTKPSVDSGIIESSLVAVEVSSSQKEACYKKRNCSIAKMKTMCGTDGKEYPSRCHVRLEACLTGESSLRVKHAGECPPQTTPPPPPKGTTPSPPPKGPCINETQSALNSNSDWIPSCDCNGYFKPVQCITQTNSCWCSDKIGILIGDIVTFSETIDFSPCL